MERKSQDAEQQLLGIVGGSSLLRSHVFESLQRVEVEGVVLHRGAGFVFCQRHKAAIDGQYRPPHLIDNAAIAAAFEKLGVKRAVGFASVGSLKLDILPGTLVVPDDYWNLFNVVSAFSDERGHISPAYDEELRQALIGVAKGVLEQEKDRALLESGVYVQTKGPRFETRAEVRFLATVGDIVGMTGAAEATMMRERGIAYASICMADNYGNGLASEPITLERFHALVALNEKTVEKVLAGVIAALTST